MKLLIFGPPGSGKGTLSAVLAKVANIPHISTGNLIRAHIELHDHLGEEFMQYTKKGQLAPDELVYEVVSDRMTKSDLGNGYLFDGFPRTLDQAKHVLKMIEVTGVVFIDTPDDVVYKRLMARGREDDSEEIVKKRIADYHQITSPILKFFEENNYPVYHQEGTWDINQTEQECQKIVNWQKSL